MKPLLPVVNAAIGFPLAESIEKIHDKKQWRKVMKQIEKTNPVIAAFIRSWSKEAGGTNSAVHSAICGILVYKLLESQAEADRMNEEFNLG